ncbi:HNH endonuclease [Escherichia coli]
MREYHGEKRYKDYLLKRYSISREGYLMKDTHGEVYRIRPKKEGRDYFFYDGVTDLKIDALKFAVLFHYDIWDSIHQLRLKDGDPNNLKATNIIKGKCR